MFCVVDHPSSVVVGEKEAARVNENEHEEVGKNVPTSSEF
jgi:hypothetical protein